MYVQHTYIDEYVQKYELCKNVILMYSFTVKMRMAETHKIIIHLSTCACTCICNFS